MKRLIIGGVVLAVVAIGGAYAATMAVSSSRLSKLEAPAVVKKLISDMKTGPAGQDGLPCFAGLQEDMNGDGIINVEDCRGEKGDKGDPGTPGTAATAATAIAAAGAKASAKTAVATAAPAPVASAPATPSATPPAPAKAKAKKAAVATTGAGNPPITFHQSVGVEVNGEGDEEEAASEPAEAEDDEAKTPFVANEGTMVFAPVNIRVGGGRKGRQ